MGFLFLLEWSAAIQVISENDFLALVAREQFHDVRCQVSQIEHGKAVVSDICV